MSERTKNWPYPDKMLMKTTEDIYEYLRKLYRALREDSSEKMMDFKNWKDAHFFISDVSPTSTDGEEGDIWLEF